MAAPRRTASRLGSPRAVSTVVSFCGLAQPKCICAHSPLSDAPSRARPRTALLRGLDRQRSPPLLPALPRPITRTSTDVPELHPPAGEHLAPVDAVLAEQPELHPLPRAALRGALRRPADRVCRPRGHHEQRPGGAERKGACRAALAARRAGMAEGMARRPTLP